MRSISLGISGEAFEAFRRDFDAMLQNTIYTMEQKDSKEAEITVKFSVTTALDTVPDIEANYPDAKRDVKRPYISHKITSKLTLKSEKAGAVVDSNVELVYDKQLCQYVLRPLDDGQTSMFDD
mgnify:FL=1